MKKTIFIFAILSFTQILFSQRTDRIVDYSNTIVRQSTVKDLHGPELAIDGVKVMLNGYTNTLNGNYTDTYYGEPVDPNGGNGDPGVPITNPPYPENCTNNTPWWEIDLGAYYDIKAISIYTPEALEDYYIFFSATSFSCDDIDVILADEWVKYMHVESELPQGIPLETPTCEEVRWIRIQGDSYNIPIKLAEVELFGEYVSTTVGVNVNNCFGEICGDGIDNDGNGLTDCEDWPCKVGTVYKWPTNPTCPICNDGKICIVANAGEQISIDGGNSWHSLVEPFCVEDLGVGDHTFIIKSFYGCEEEFTITLTAPPGNPTAHCPNGDFENGNFDGWTGGIGDNDNGTAVFPNDNTDIDTEGTSDGLPRHEIINTLGFVDPNIPYINGELPGIGRYIAKLGNTEVGAKAERLTYCFEVDEDNMDFYFYYSVVMQDPNHWHPLYNRNPFLEWSIYDGDDKVRYGIVKSGDNFLEAYGYGHAEIKYKTWTCVNYDLAEFDGKELCIEFINADCTEEGHWGYSYIDGLCNGSLEPNPIVDISNDIFCKNQKINANIRGTAYNEYFYNFLIYNANGDLVDEYVSGIYDFENTPYIPYDPSIPDIKEFYEDKTGNVLPINHKILFGFTGKNDCDQKTVYSEFWIVNAEYDVDYCSLISYCDPYPIQMIGENDCINCDVSWTPGYPYMNFDDIPFPTVHIEYNVNSFDQEYHVEVTSPEECIYRDTVIFEENSINLQIKQDATLCDLNSEVRVVLLNDDSSMENEDIIIDIYDNLTDDPIELGVHPEGTGSIRTYNFIFDRKEDLQFRIVGYLTNFGDNCGLSPGCEDEVITSLFSKSAYSMDQWKAWWVNPLRINSGNINTDRLIIHFESVIDGDCQNTDETMSSIYYYELIVQSASGQLVFKQSVEVDPHTDPDGILGDEIIWNLTSNGNYPVSPGSYKLIVTVKSICNIEDESGCSYYSNNNETNGSIKYPEAYVGEYQFSGWVVVESN